MGKCKGRLMERPCLYWSHIPRPVAIKATGLEGELLRDFWWEHEGDTLKSGIVICITKKVYSVYYKEGIKWSFAWFNLNSTDNFRPKIRRNRLSSYSSYSWASWAWLNEEERAGRSLFHELASATSTQPAKDRRRSNEEADNLFVTTEPWFV